MSDLGDGWVESVELITGDHRYVAYDIAQFVKNNTTALLWSWRGHDVEKIVELIEGNEDLGPLVKQVGDRVEYVVHYRDPLAASGYLRVVKKEGDLLWRRCWIS